MTDTANNPFAKEQEIMNELNKNRLAFQKVLRLKYVGRTISGMMHRGEKREAEITSVTVFHDDIYFEWQIFRKDGLGFLDMDYCTHGESLSVISHYGMTIGAYNPATAQGVGEPAGFLKEDNHE